jgi:methionyl-tRNA formyltransferase
MTDILDIYKNLDNDLKKSFNTKKRFKVICFLARDCGVEVLKELINDGRFEIVTLFAHSKLPKSEDQNRGTRNEFSIFKEMSYTYSIPLITIDTIEESKNTATYPEFPFDFLISVSWRFLIGGDVFSKAKIAAINIHRGKLPEYAGAEPIKRSLENGEKYITLTVHEMTKEVDSGKVLVEKIHFVNYDNSKSLIENVERIKIEILPLYFDGVIEAIDRILLGDTV